MITANQIYDTLANALDGVYTTKYYERIEEQLPCVYFRESHSTIRSSVDLSYQHEAVQMYCYIEVYGNDLDEIVNTIEATMKSMCFIEELNEMIPNYNPSVERISMRFGRVICEGDTLNE